MIFGRASQVKPDWLIVGLGNPGEKYANTRHNLGFWVVDALAERLNAGRRYRKSQGELRDTVVGNSIITLVKPMTFMNGSGLCVGPLKRRNPDANLPVVFDDVNLPLGKIRLRTSGSGGGHKGAASIIRHFSEDFYRVRLGIGGGELKYLTDWVLEPFEPDELPVALDMVARAVAKIEDIIVNGWEKAATGEFNPANTSNPGMPEAEYGDSGS